MVFLPLVDVFGDDDVARLFSEESLVGAWLEVERALAATQAELGIIPAQAAAEIALAATPERIELASLRERTLVVGYPILPLLEQIGRASPEAARYLHWGATTQDIMDTGLALIAGRVLDRIEALAQELGGELASTADAHRATVMPGRTHAQPAVPITFGGQAGGLARRAHTPCGAARRRSCAGRGRPALRRRRHGCGARARQPRRPARCREAAGTGSRRRSVAHGS